MERRLAAVLAADVVGYSRLIRADEEGTIAALKALQTDLIDPKLDAHNGRIVKLMGDGMLVEFGSVVDAVRAATEMQRAVAEYNSSLPEDRRIEFRVGINLGDVVIDGEDIHGDGVNIAARLETFSKPGGICVSGKVYEEVRDRTDFAFEDLGDQVLKNIDRPVRTWRWAPAQVDGSSNTGVGVTKTLTEKPAIAVLPFTNMSDDPDQEYFADGLTEDIITALTYWRSFPVIARNSSFAYKNKAEDVKQVGRELGAQYLLEGSIRKLGGRIRISAQLIDGASGHHVWAEKYDRELDDIFEVQDDIVQRIAAHVAPELTKAELKRSINKQPDDLDAWDLCMRAMPLVRQRTKQGNAKARELFLRAVSARPDYADAYAGLAMSHHQDILIGVSKNRMETATKAMEAAQKAVECDEASSWAHHELGTAYQWLNRPDDALDEARIAVDLNPNDAYALHALGNKSDLAGERNGIALMEKAEQLNPEDASRHTHLTFLARAYLNVGDNGIAADRARHAIRRQPDYAPAYYILAIALGHFGQLDEARATLAKCDEISPGFVDSRQRWQPYADPASNERLQEGLCQIGE